MKKIRKIFIILQTFFVILSLNMSYATTVSDTAKKSNPSEITSQNFSAIQIICVGIGVALILLILFISYKTDKLSENSENDEENNDDTKDDDTFKDLKDEVIEPIQENNVAKEDNPMEKSLYETFETIPESDFSVKDESKDESINEEIKVENIIENKPKRATRRTTSKTTPKMKIDNDFILDEIFDKEIPVLDTKIEKKKSTKKVEENIPEETTKKMSIEDDFLAQMNKNLEKKEKSRITKKVDKEEN